MSAAQLMLLPLLECLVLVGIHSYLGLHVLRRRVIFVDLALAQIAALGTTIAFIFHIAPDSTGAYIFSLLFTLVGATVFSLTRMRKDLVPQEAVIGLVYALAAAVGILVVYYAPHGAEHIQQVLMGSILWVKAEEVRNAAIAYTAVGAFHWVFRDKFLAISENHEEAEKQGINVRLWDFLFYASFGLVITFSVHTAGVLLVFVFLIVPAIMAMLITPHLGKQLAVGWTTGTLVSFGGMALSYYGDLPSGPTVVTVYGAVLLLTALVLYVVRATDRGRALRHLGVGVAATLVVVFGFRGLGHWMADQPALAQGPHHDDGHHHLAHHPDGGAYSDHDHHAHHAGAEVASPPGPQRAGDGDAPAAGASTQPVGASGHAATPPPAALADSLATLDITQKQARLAKLTDVAALRPLLASSVDVETRVVAAERLLDLGAPEAAPALLAVMSSADAAPILRDEASERLAKAHGGDARGYDPWSDPTTADNVAALARWRAALAPAPPTAKPPGPTAVEGTQPPAAAKPPVTKPGPAAKTSPAAPR